MWDNKRNLLIALITAVSLGSVVSLVNGADGNQTGPVAAAPKPAQADPGVSFRMNRFTAPETDKNRAVPASKIPDGYKLVSSSPALELYADASWSGIAVRNRNSGYVWTSVPREEDIKESGLNQEWETAARSPFMLEYFNKSSQLLRGNLMSLKGKAVEGKQTADGFRAVYELPDIGIRLAMEVKLEGDSLAVRIPNDSIVESGTDRLASVQPFPFFGSVKEAKVPGYMFIPDGSGALIRFQAARQRFDEPFTGDLYGSDRAVRTINTKKSLARSPEPVSVPVFGIVHGVEQNGFTAILENGKYNAEILAYPTGVNTLFNWVSGKFILRRAYFQPTSKSMGGYNTFQKTKNEEDLQIRYLFQSGADADYVGMASAYRDYLMKSGALTAKPEPKTAVPLRLEVFGAENKKKLIGSSAMKMTSFDETRSMVDELKAQGVGQMSVVYNGWNNGGKTAANPDKFPVESALGGDKGLASLKDHLKGLGFPLYLSADYTAAFGKNDNFKPNTDAARKITNEVMQSVRWADGADISMDIYYMQPGRVSEIAGNDASRFKERGVDGVSIDGLGSQLFSDYSGDHPLSRAGAVKEYSNLAETMRKEVGKLALYGSNDYMFPYLDQLYDIPMSSSQFMYSTDTVPFLQLVLHGSVDYFAPFANYNSSPKEFVLHMVEYGAYPSYMVTHEPSWKLKNTLNDRYFTSAFQDWKGDISASYKRVNDALSRVQASAVKDRSVPDWGIVDTVYENGVRIVVNYRPEETVVSGRKIPAMDFAVWGGSSQ